MNRLYFYFLTGVFYIIVVSCALTHAKNFNTSLFQARHHPKLIHKNFTSKKPARQQASSKSYNITLKTEDGLIRKGVLTIRKNPKGNIVLCHPAAHNKESMIQYEKIFDKYNCLRFDLRRHGENSEKQYTTFGKKEIYEIDAAMKILNKHPETKDLRNFGFGISLSAVILLETQSRRHYFDALILQAPFESLRKQAQRTFPFFSYPFMGSFVYSYPSKLFAKNKYRIKLHRINPSKSIQNITKPIFLIHAKDDPTISFKAFERLKKVGRCICKTWTPDTGGHTALFKTCPKIYSEKCNSFLNSLSQMKTNSYG